MRVQREKLLHRSPYRGGKTLVSLCRGTEGYLRRVEICRYFIQVGFGKGLFLQQVVQGVLGAELEGLLFVVDAGRP